MPIAQWLNEICLISLVPTSGNSAGMRGRNPARTGNSEWGESGIPRESRTRSGENRESRENRELGMGRIGNPPRIGNSEWGESGIPRESRTRSGGCGNLENTLGLEKGLLSSDVILATLWDLSTLRRLWTYWALRGLLRIVVD